MTVLMFYKIKPDRERLLKNIKYKKDNYTAYDIVKMSKAYNLKCTGIKTSYENLNKFPVIAHIITPNNYFHFIVIYKIDKKRRVIIAMDPAIGMKEISFKSFNDMTTNIFLTFKKPKKNCSEKRLKKELLKIVGNNKKMIIKTLILSVFFVALSLIFNYYLKLVLTYNKHTSTIKLIFLSFLIICSLKTLINYLKNKLVLELSIKIDKDITKRVINHLFHLPSKYFNRKTSGELITIISDVESFKNCIIKIFILSSVDLILLLIVIIYIYFLNFYIGLYLTLFLAIIFVFTSKYKYIFRDNFLPFKVKYIDYNSTLIEFLNGINSIKNLTVEENIYNILTNKYDLVKEKERTYNKKHYSYEFILSFIIDLVYLLLIIIVLVIIMNSKTNIYDIVLFSSIFYLIINFSNSILDSMSSYKVEESKVNRVLDLLNLEKEESSKTKFKNINSIHYKNVSYSGLLKNINLHINKGDKIFITGESGIGKTTLFKMLHYDFIPSSGSILLDNVDISLYDSVFLRSKIVYVSQNESLFKGSINSNLSLVNNNLDSIKEVSSFTLLDKILKTKKTDYNYFVSEFSSNISGGEKKKIVLTRALLKPFDILILDETFNEISIEEESTILRNIFERYYDKTIILISHRQSNMYLFSKKYLMKGDGLIEIK